MATRIEDGLFRGVRTALLGLALVVHCLFAIPRMVTDPQLYQPIWPHVTASVMLLGLGAAGAWYVATNRAIPASQSAVGVGVTFCASLVSLLPLAASDVLRTEHWSYGVVGWYCLFLMFERSTRSIPVVLGAHCLLALAPFAYYPVPDPRVVAAMATSLVSVYGFQTAVGMITVVVRDTAVGAAHAAGEEQRQRTAEAIAENLHRDSQARMLALMDTTIPLLRALADGRLEPSDPATQRRCAAESARIRQMLVETDDVSDPLVNELKAVLDVADRRGVTTQFDVAGTAVVPIPREVRRELLDPIAGALAASRNARVAVSHTQAEVRVSVVGDASDVNRAWQLRRVRVETIATEGKVWITTAWSATKSPGTTHTPTEQRRSP